MSEHITYIYCFVDDFCKLYSEVVKSHLLPELGTRQRHGKMSMAELMTILLCFYTSPCKDFKSYYLYYLPHRYSGYFPNSVSYSRFITLLPRLLVPISILLHCLSGEATGTYYVDSTKLAICHNKRTSSNRVFGRIAKMGKSSYGWFMGFKLHLIINNKGQIMAVTITRAGKSDVSMLDGLCKNLSGKIYGDKAYISRDLFIKLQSRGLMLYTALRRTMRNQFMSLADKINLRKRSLIESVFNILKNRMGFEHTRHRSPTNFLVHIVACLCAYALKPAKSLPSLFIS